MNRERRALESLDQEIRDHIERETQDNINRGLTPQEARRVAVLRFGNVALVKEDTRAVWVVVWLEQLLQDIRFGIRTLRKHPGFTAGAVLSLALGMGANTAIFSVLNAVVLRPLPYDRPDELVRVWEGMYLAKGWLASYAEAKSFEGVTGYEHETAVLTDFDEPQVLAGGEVAVSHFSVLGVPPALGRGFVPEEGLPGAEPPVILSHGLWQSRFGGDPDIVGKSIGLKSGLIERRTVVGVMPADHQPLGASWQWWTPIVFRPTTDAAGSGQGCMCWAAVARLRTGVSAGQASAEVQVIAERLRELNVQNAQRIQPEEAAAAGVISLRESVVGSVKSTLIMLFGAVGLVLLIACTNVTNLLLARAGARERELAVRHALGASRSRIARQLVTESVVLGALGGVGGIVIGVLALAVMRGHLASTMPRAATIGLDAAVLGFALGVSLLVGLAVGLVPALRGDDQAHAALTHSGRSDIGPRRRKLSRGLVTAEIALSVMLVVGAGLLVKSIVQLRRVDPGFMVENLLTLRVMPSPTDYDRFEGLPAYYRDVTAAIEAVPGVAQAGAVQVLPLSGATWGWSYGRPDEPSEGGQAPHMALFRVATVGYFETMHIPLITGRRFTEQDIADNPQVALVNQALAREHWSDGNALGKRLQLTDGRGPFEIVGVVGDTLHEGLDQAVEPEIYRPFNQLPQWSMSLTVRTTLSASTILPTLREAVWSVDDNVPIPRSGSVESVVTASIADSRFIALLLSAFAGLALVLGMVGVYGVLSYTVSQQRREIAIRIALGARRERLIRSIVTRSMTPVALGVALGLGGAVLGSQGLSSLLYSVKGTDPLVLGGAAFFLLLTALLANYIPAWRATRVDALEALRAD